MQEIDRVLKILSGRFPNAFLKLLFRDRTYIILSRLEDTQLNIPEYRSDKISRLKHYDKKTVLKLEFMIQPRMGALNNFLIKTALLMANYALPANCNCIFRKRKI